MGIEDARRYAAEIWGRRDMTRSERLAAVSADAHIRGKEPFDLDRLEEICDTSDEGRRDPVHWRKRKYELIYYSHPEMTTIEDLAEHIMLSRGRTG